LWLRDFDFYPNVTMEKYLKMTVSVRQQSLWVIKDIEGMKDKISRGLGRLG